MKLTEQQVESLELQKEEALQAKALGDALIRLRSNPDYQLVIEEHFLKEYPRQMADAIVKNTGAYDADTLANNIKAINTYVGFTFQIGTQYNVAVDDINSIEQVLAHDGFDLDENEGE